MNIIEKYLIRIFYLKVAINSALTIFYLYIEIIISFYLKLGKDNFYSLDWHLSHIYDLINLFLFLKLYEI